MGFIIEALGSFLMHVPQLIFKWWFWLTASMFTLAIYFFETHLSVYLWMSLTFLGFTVFTVLIPYIWKK
jgi:hypothetical protein